MLTIVRVHRAHSRDNQNTRAPLASPYFTLAMDHPFPIYTLKTVQTFIQWLRLIDFAAHQPFAVGLLCSMAAQYAVQIECRTDQRKMREGLGKITQRLTLRTYLF